jgi:membrane-associated phospholipid phosphatase
MALYFGAVQRLRPEFSVAYSIVSVVGTSMFTLLIPAGCIIFLWKTQRIDSLHIDNPKQRTSPYIYTIMAYGFWAYFIYDILHLPLLMLTICLGAILALTAVTIINHWWKISAHLTGIGGLLGGICSFSLFSINTPTALIIIVLVIALLLMYARLYLNAHTPLQVVAGLLLGLLSVFIPNLIICYA